MKKKAIFALFIAAIIMILYRLFDAIDISQYPSFLTDDENLLHLVKTVLSAVKDYILYLAAAISVSLADFLGFFRDSQDDVRKRAPNVGFAHTVPTIARANSPEDAGKIVPLYFGDECVYIQSELVNYGEETVICPLVKEEPLEVEQLSKGERTKLSFRINDKRCHAKKFKVSAQNYRNEQFYAIYKLSYNPVNRTASILVHRKFHE